VEAGNASKGFLPMEGADVLMDVWMRTTLAAFDCLRHIAEAKLLLTDRFNSGKL